MPHGGRFGGLFQCCDMSVVVYFGRTECAGIYYVRVPWSSINNVYLPRQARRKLLACLPNCTRAPNDQKRDAMCWKLEKIGIKIQTAPRLLTVAGLNCRTKVSSATFGRTMGGSIVSVAAVWDGIWGAQVASCVARCGGWWCECGLENCKIRPFLFLVCASSGGAPRFCFSFFQHIATSCDRQSRYATSISHRPSSAIDSIAYIYRHTYIQTHQSCRPSGAYHIFIPRTWGTFTTDRPTR